MPFSLKKYFTLFFLLVFQVSICLAQEKILYKQIDTTKLFVEVYYPEKKESSVANPAIIFFFGGCINPASLLSIKR